MRAPIRASIAAESPSERFRRSPFCDCRRCWPGSKPAFLVSRFRSTRATARGSWSCSGQGCSISLCWTRPLLAPGEPHRHRAGDANEITWESAYSEELVLVVGRRHRLAEAREVRWTDLSDEAFIMFHEGSMLRSITATAAAAAGFTTRTAFEVSETETLRAFVSAGLGVSVLSRSMADAPGPPVQRIRLTAPRLVRTVRLGWRPAGRRESRRHRTHGARSLATGTHSRMIWPPCRAGRPSETSWRLDAEALHQ